MKYGILGDPHVTKSNLPEAERLVDWFAEECRKHVAIPLILGDLYDDFGIARVEVVEFWQRKLPQLGSWHRATIIPGNHDFNAERTSTILVAHNRTADVVPTEGMPLPEAPHGIWCISYKHDNQDFVDAVLKAYQEGYRYFICHVEVDGSQMDNGFYSPHGVDLSLLPPDIRIISGHIHTKQTIKNVFYPGTPRQKTFSDVGKVKGIHIWDTDVRDINGEVNHFEFIPTPETVSEPFRVIQLTKADDISLVPDSDRLFVEIHGSKEFVHDAQKRLPNKVRTRPVYDAETVIGDIKESEGVNVAFGKYKEKYFADNQLSVEMKAAIEARIRELCPGIGG